MLQPRCFIAALDDGEGIGEAVLRRLQNLAVLPQANMRLNKEAQQRGFTMAVHAPLTPKQ